MVDLSEFEKLSRPRSKKNRCPVGLALEVLDQEEAESLSAAIDKPEVITNNAITKWLETRSIKASVTAITYHRSKKCSCYD